MECAGGISANIPPARREGTEWLSGWPLPNPSPEGGFAHLHAIALHAATDRSALHPVVCPNILPTRGSYRRRSVTPPIRP